MKQKHKKLSFDFWLIKMPATYAGGFGDALEAMSKVESIPKRNAEINKYTVRWEEISIQPRYIMGDFVKLRLDILPLKGGVDSKSMPLNLRLSEGISEPFAFLFDTQSSILVTQKNRYGASVSMFIEYVEKLGAVGEMIEIFPVLSKEGIQKLRQMDDVRTVSYKIAKPTQAEVDFDSNDSVDSAISTMRDVGGETIEVRITSGRKRKSLTLRNIARLAGNLLGGKTTGSAVVKKFEISGYTNGHRDEFDLIKEQLRATQEVPIAQSRSLSYNDRKNAITLALNSQKSELVGLFGNCCK